MQHPVQIDYGVVHDAHYVVDFGRVEARVRLHMQGAGPEDKGIELITSVAPYADETEQSLKTRLVISAARLFRRMEARELHKAPDPYLVRVA